MRSRRDRLRRSGPLMPGNCTISREVPMRSRCVLFLALAFAAVAVVPTRIHPLHAQAAEAGDADRCRLLRGGRAHGGRPGQRQKNRCRGHRDGHGRHRQRWPLPLSGIATGARSIRPSRSCGGIRSGRAPGRRHRPADWQADDAGSEAAEDQRPRLATDERRLVRELPRHRRTERFDPRLHALSHDGAYRPDELRHGPDGRRHRADVDVSAAVVPAEDPEAAGAASRTGSAVRRAAHRRVAPAGRVP